MAHEAFQNGEWDKAAEVRGFGAAEMAFVNAMLDEPSKESAQLTTTEPHELDRPTSGRRSEPVPPGETPAVPVVHIVACGRDGQDLAARLEHAVNLVHHRMRIARFVEQATQTNDIDGGIFQRQRIEPGV